MHGRALLVPLVVALLTAVAPAAASAEEKLLTLYSPAIETKPYVHDTHHLALRPNGREAPATPGYITGVKEQVLVDSKDPDAEPLDNARFMIHHFLFWAPGRVDQAPGSCWGESGFVAGRGEEHPGGDFAAFSPPELRARYGITNRTAAGTAPPWRLTAMVMNHVKRPKTVWVRLRIWYTDEPREPISPVVVGNCRHLGNGMAYDVPGGGGRGAEFVDESTWTVPEGFDGRIVGAASHQHGGGKYHTLASETCDRPLLRAETYHAPPDHIYNTIRPILHEPGPIANGTFRSAQGIPITAGEVLRRRAVHDNANLHVAAMGFWVLLVARDESVTRCAPIPDDVREITRPRRFDPTPNHGLRVPQLAPPRAAAFRPLGRSPLLVDDVNFAPGRVAARVGRPITWRFDALDPHTVTVANGPEGFSSIYWGQPRGTYTFTPRRRGTYRLTCLVHPTRMGQTLVVR
ncbi:MAG TPA: hypothetical protein VHF89_01520 [Solirubrobacteraceae bacterium]|nr:hypothetical protein [Solirubrobacteraceae bacterium]